MNGRSTRSPFLDRLPATTGLITSAIISSFIENHHRPVAETCLLSPADLFDTDLVDERSTA